MNVAVFLTHLGLGGTEKAACRWAWGLKERGHDVVVLTLTDGPRRAELERHAVTVRVLETAARPIANALKEIKPDIIHVHAPGHVYPGDVLGEALALLPKRIPVVQTNVFGHLWNKKEDAWTDFRLYISWVSCVQAARRVLLPLNEDFFQRNSVAVYPLDTCEPSPAANVASFRRRHGVADDEILFGRFSRPDPVKWTDLVIDAFRLALAKNKKIKLLFRESPPHITAQLRAAPDADRFLILPATGEAEELRLSMSAIDAGLHTSTVGESFGYGIAELMNLGKPVITHSVPWHDQAQLELVRHNEHGFVTSIPATMAEAVLKLAGDQGLREQMGRSGQQHIRELSDPETSLRRIEAVFQSVLDGKANPHAVDDLRRAQETANYLDSQQFGHSFREQMILRAKYCQARLYQLRDHYRHGHGKRN